MLTLLAQFLARLKPFLASLLKFMGLLCLILAAVVLFEWQLWPRLATTQWFEHLEFDPALGQRTTIIERHESVTITPDESFERLVAEHGAVVVGIIEQGEVAGSTLSNKLQQHRFFSGTLVTNDGLVVTYVDQAPTTPSRVYTVLLGDGRAIAAQVIGYDTLTELLYLRLQGTNTSAVAFSNSLDIKAGRRVALMGMLRELRLTITPSLIESLDRTFNLAPQTVALSEKWEGVFGIPSEVTPQYVGGPALLSNGELAGIVGQQRIDGEVSSFLIPANAVRESLDRVIAGNAARPTAGIYYLPLTPTLQATLGLDRDRGALVYSPSERTGLSVIAGSPAAQAGIQFGDIIIAVNGAEINLDLPLSVALGRLSVGDTATLKVLRAGVEKELLLSL